ncbi:hypothetical protein [Lacipirellula sp.]|uniref:hypothetical protein n=1 Tax=Lacipirellula sp. TaxID=2691419 RepID=UPI003D0B8AB9
MRSKTGMSADLQVETIDAARLRYGSEARLQQVPAAYPRLERAEKTQRWADLMNEYGTEAHVLPFEAGLSEARDLVEAVKNFISTGGAAESVDALGNELLGFERTIDEIEKQVEEIAEMKLLSQRIHMRRHVITLRGRVVAMADSRKELLAELTK